MAKKSYSSIKAGVGSTTTYTEPEEKKKYSEINSSNFKLDVNDEYVNSYLKQSQSMLENAKDDYENNSVSTAAGTSDYYDKLRKELNEQGNNVRAYLNAIKDSIKEGDYDNLMSYVSDVKDASAGFSKAFGDAKDFYSNWQTQEQFDNDVTLPMKYEGMSVDELKKDQAERKQKDLNDEASKLYANTDWDNYEPKVKDGGILYYDDMGEAVTYDKLIRMKTAENNLTNLESDANASSAYEAVKTTEDDYNKLVRLQEMLNSAMTKDTDAIVANDAEEQEILTYIGRKYGIDFNSGAFNAIGKVEALTNEIADKRVSDRDYLSGLGYDYDELEYYKKWKEDRDNFTQKQEEIKDYAINHKTAATIMSMLASPLQVGDLAKNAYYAGKAILRGGDSAYGLANIYDDGVTTFNQNATGAVAEYINDYVRNKTNSKVLSWLASNTYQGITSSVQSHLTTAACVLMFGPAGEAISLALMGSEAASSGFQSAVRNGSSNGEALLTSLANGINEALFEKVSLESYKSIKNYLESPTNWNVSNLANLLKSAAVASKKPLVQGLVEASEEGFTDLFNTLADGIINGDHSEYQTNVNKYINQGYERGEAEKLASLDWCMDVLGSLYGGFVGGFGSSQVHVIGDTALRVPAAVGNQMRTTMINNMMGREIVGNNNVGELISQAKDIEGLDKKINKVEGVDTSNMSDSEKAGYAKNVGKLYGDVYESQTKTLSDTSETFKNELRSALQERNVENIDEATTAVIKAIYGMKLTDNQQEIFDKIGGQEIVDNIDSIAKSDESKKFIAGLKSTKELNRITSDRIARGLNESKEKTAIRTAEETAGNRVSGTNSATLNSTNEQVEITKISSVKGNEMMLELSDGRVVNSKDVNYKSKSDAIVYEAVMKMGLDAESANSIVHGYGGLDNMSARNYLLGVTEGMNYGRLNYPQNRIDTDGFYADLTQSQKNFAYKLGQKQAQEQFAKEQSRFTGEKNNGRRHGKVHLDVDRSTLTDAQSSSVKTLEWVAKNVTRNDIFLYETVKNDKGQMVFKSDVGEYKAGDKAPNGWYDSKTGAVYIDLNAGKNGEGTILWTAAHEFTHYIREWSPAKFKILSDFLMEEYGKKGVDIQTLAKNQMDKYKNTGRNISYTEAYEEVVADSMEKMFTDTNLNEKLAKLVNKDRSLVVKIKQFIDDLYNKITEAYAGFTNTSTEAKYVSEMGVAVEKLSDMFAEALIDAGENKYHYGVTFKNGTLIKNSLRTWNATDIERLTQDLKDAGFDEKEIKKWIKDVNGIASMVATQDNLDYKADLDQTSMKSDEEYIYTIDFSTLCAKRLLYQGTYDKIQEMLPDYAIMPGDTLLIRRIMDDLGHEVPCAFCYVESRRKLLGKFAERWLKEVGRPVYGVSNVDVTSTKGLQALKVSNPEAAEDFTKWMRMRGSANPKVVELRTEYGENAGILNLSQKQIKTLEKIGGLRIQSFSDFELVHTIDMMQVVLDMARMNIKSQAYTKVPEFAYIFGGTGIKINLSVVADLDEKGNLKFNDKEGIDHKEALKLRKMYDKNVGTILVGKNEQQIRVAMADNRIDFIIPFHRSGWGKAEFRVLGLNGYQDFQNIQGEFNLDYSPLSKERKKAGGFLFPEDYWDYNVSGDENTVRYLEKCRELGRIPRFLCFAFEPSVAKAFVEDYNKSHSTKITESDILTSDGMAKLCREANQSKNLRQIAFDYLTYGLDHGAKVQTGYWKTLIDYRMYDSDGNSAPQQAVTPNFNMKYANKFLNEYEGNPNSLPVDMEAAQQFVDLVKSGDNKKYLKRLKDAERRHAAELSGKMSLRDFDEKQLTNSKYNEEQTGVGSPLRTMAYSKKSGGNIERMGGVVGKNLGTSNKPWLYFHRQYLDDAIKTANIDTNDYSKALEILKSKKPELAKKFNHLAYNATNNSFMFGYSPDFDTAREPVAGEQLQVFLDDGRTTYKPNNRAIFHHKWLWVENDYDGFDVEESWNWSKEWLNALRPTDQVGGGFAPKGVADGTNIDAWNRQLDHFGLPHDKVANNDTRFSLRMVDPIQPTSDKWSRSATTDEVMKLHPTLWDISTESQEDRNPTQIKGTVKTYNNVYNMLKAEGFNGTILDASSGMGVGTESGRQNYGFDVDDIEPFPGNKYKPKYTDYSKLDKTYDFIISNAVLNVLPQEQRDALVVKMGELLNPGGRMFVNVRGRDVENASSKIAIDADNMEYFIAGKNTYQKGFTKAELKAYLEDALGDGYTVSDAKGFSGVPVIVTKDADTIQYSLRDEINEQGFYSQMARVVKDYKGEKLGATSVISYLKGKGVKDEEIKWSGIEDYLKGKKSVSKQEILNYIADNSLEIEEQKRTISYDSNNIDDYFTARETAMEMAYDKLRNEGVDVDYDDLAVDDIDYGFEVTNKGESVLKWEVEKESTRWGRYKLNGGDNYREILFKMPGSEYTNDSMQTHWREKGVLAHARVQDMPTADGKNMLFVEEIQSDWHNAGAKKGYKQKNRFIAVENDGKYDFGNSIPYGVYDTVEKKVVSFANSMERAVNAVSIEENIQRGVPDAPFKSGKYIEYVLKRLIREAAEKGYDYVGWTTGKQQENRWSSQYAEGYRIEYDQDIPKFLNKYGKKWGIKVSDIGLDIESERDLDDINVLYDVVVDQGIVQSRDDIESIDDQGDSFVVGYYDESGNYDEIVMYKDEIEPPVYTMVHSIPITDEMKQSVLTEGQSMFSIREIVDTDGNSYGMGVYLDDTTLDNLDEKDRVKFVREYVKELGDKNNPLIAFDSNNNPVEFYVSNKKYKTLKGEPRPASNDLATKFTKNKIKQESINSIEELVFTSTYDGSKPSGYSHDWVDNYGKNNWDYWSVYIQDRDNKIWRAVLNITTAQDGTKILYDIDPIKDIKKTGQAVKSATSAVTNIVAPSNNGSQSPNSLRDTDSTDNRTLLSNALASIAQDDIEKKVIQDYQANIEKLNAEQAKLSDLRSQIKELTFGKGEKNPAKLKALREEATKTANRINIYDKKLLKLEATKPLQQVVARERAKAVKKMAEKYRDRTNSRIATRYRNEVKEYIEDFRKMIQHPTDSKYIPKELIGGVISVYDILDPTGENQDTKSAQNFRTLRESLLNLKVQYDALPTKDYEFASEFNEEFSQSLKDLVDVVDNTPLRDMDRYQLEDVYQVLHQISTMIRSARKQIGVNERITNYEAGQEIIENMNNVVKKGLRTTKVGDLLREWTENPMRAAREMSGFDENSRLVKLFNALNEGRRKADDFRMKSNKRFEAFRNEDEKTYTNAIEKATVECQDVDGNDVKISKMQALQALLTYEREISNLNRKHLETPVIFTNVEDEAKGNYSKAFDNGIEVMITPEFVNKVKASLTDWDMRFLQEAREFFNKDAKDAVNSVTMVLNHRMTALENNYIPYKVNQDYVARESDNVAFNASIMNEGILKSVKNNAPQQLVMRGLNTIISDHIDDVAKIYGLAIPVRNWNKAFNIKQTKEDGGRSVKSEIRNAWGDGGLNLLDQAVADLQSNRRQETVKLLSTVKSGFVSGALASNVSVWLKQAASYPTAGAYLSTGSLVKALPSFGKNLNSLWDEIDEHTPQHWIRRQGMSSQELGEMNQTNGWQNKLNKKLGVWSPMNWIQAMDVKTTAVLWNACKNEIESRGITEGDKQYWDQVTDLYNKVIEDTQPMYDPLHRAEVTKNASLKNIIMFQTQPLQNSGILREGAIGYKMAKKQYGSKSEQAVEAGKKYRMAVTSQLASHFVFTAMTLVSSALLHKMNAYRDDDDELTGASVSKTFIEQFMKNVFGAVLPIVGNYAVSIAEKIVGNNRYDVLSDPTVDKINTTINNFAKLKNPSVDQFINCATDVAAYFQIPAQNMKNIIEGAILHIKDAANGEFGSFEAGVDRTSKQDVSRAYKAYVSGDTSKMKQIINDKISSLETDSQRSAFTSSTTSYLKPIFLKAYNEKDNETMANIRKFMNASGVYKSDVVKLTQDWIKNSNK